MAQDESFGSTRNETTRSARSVATFAVAEHAKRFPDLVPKAVETNGLDERDAALAHALHDAVVRRWLTLGALLDRCLSQPFDQIEPKLTAVLLVGSAQLVLFDRIPAHAAVDEAVEWAKRHIRPKAGGLVNAVLRGVSRLVGSEQGTWSDGRDQILLSNGMARGLSEEVLPADPIDRLAVQTSLPVGVVRRWIDARGVGDARAAALASVAEAPVILNTEHAAEIPAGARPHEVIGHHVFNGSAAELGRVLARDAGIWVQDPASADAVRSVRGLAPKLIVDVCAGRGTKTRQLAKLFPQARIVAGDVDRDRSRDLQKVFRGQDQVEVVAVSEMVLRVAGQADLVLLDVPCSNSGVFARRPEAKYRFGRDQTRRLGQIQRQLIADAVPMLSGRGVILYATCSLEAEENAGPLAWSSEWHRFRIRSSRLAWPKGLPGADAAGHSDGAFSALLER